MPTGAVLLVRMQRSLSESALARLRELFLAENRLGEDDFYPGGPLIIIRHPNEGPMPIRDGRSLRLNTNIFRSYFGPGYKRGDVELITGTAARPRVEDAIKSMLKMKSSKK